MREYQDNYDHQYDEIQRRYNKLFWEHVTLPEAAVVQHLKQVLDSDRENLLGAHFGVILVGSMAEHIVDRTKIQTDMDLRIVNDARDGMQHGIVQSLEDRLRFEFAALGMKQLSGVDWQSQRSWHRVKSDPAGEDYDFGDNGLRIYKGGIDGDIKFIIPSNEDISRRPIDIIISPPGSANLHRHMAGESQNDRPHVILLDTSRGIR